MESKSSYYQIKVKDEDIHKTTFRTKYDHYEFAMLPYGLINASTTFIHLINIVFNKYLDNVVLIFIDDILVYSKKPKEHKQHLRMTLQTLKEHHIYVKFSKCKFYQNQIQYLGHAISKEGIVVDLKKVKEIPNWHVPQDLENIRSFMGITRCYHRFIEGLSKLAYLVTSLKKMS